MLPNKSSSTIENREEFISHFVDTFRLLSSKVCASLNQSILKLRLFTSVLFDKKVWWFLSAALKFHPTFQISVELNLFLRHFHL